MRRAIIGLLVLGAVALAAGCGGSGASDSGGTTTAATEANTTLTSAQWQQYETARAALAKQSAATTVTFKKCSATAQQGQATKWQACVGDTFSALSAAAGDSRTTLQGFSSTVSGACATALANLLNYVGTYQAAADGMQRVVDSADLSAYPAASQDLATASSAGKAEAKTFDQDCAPA